MQALVHQNKHRETRLLAAAHTAAADHAAAAAHPTLSAQSHAISNAIIQADCSAEFCIAAHAPATAELKGWHADGAHVKMSLPRHC